MSVRQPGWLVIVILTLLFTLVHGVVTTPIPFITIGTEGSVVASLMIVVATALVLAVYRRRESAQPSETTPQASALP